MAGSRSVRIITLGDPDDVACMDNRVQVVTLDDPSRATSTRRGQFPMPGRCSSVTRVFCGPVETIGMQAPPQCKQQGSRMDWRLTPEGALEVKVGRPLTRDEEEQRERERKESKPPAKEAAKDAKDAKDAAAAKPAEAKSSTTTLKKALCDPISLLSNWRLPICFETTLGQETQGLSSVTVVNQQPNNPVAVQPRPAACPQPKGSGTSGIQVICSTDGFGGGYQAPVMSRCTGIGGGGGPFAGVRISTSSPSSAPGVGRCEPLLPGPCPTGGMERRQVIRISEEDEDEPALRVVRIYPEQGGRSRSRRQVDGEERRAIARVVHIQEDCPDYM